MLGTQNGGSRASAASSSIRSARKRLGCFRGGGQWPVIWPEGLAAGLGQWREGRQGRSVGVQAAAVTATRQPGQQRRRRAGDVDWWAGVDVQRGGGAKQAWRQRLARTRW